MSRRRRAARPSIVAGLAAGATGTAALHAVEWLQAALGGPDEDASAYVASEVAERAGAEGLAERPRDEALRRRFSRAGTMVEHAGGLVLGAAYGAARPRAAAAPGPLAGVALGLAEMATARLTAAALGVDDPREWPGGAWAADAAAHLAFGITAALVFDALTRE